MMLESFHEGGWGMYPTLFSGLFLLGASIQYARQRQPQGQGLLWVLSALTLLVGTLGFLTGFMRTLMAAGDSGRVQHVWVGTAESLHNVTLALCLIIASCIAIAIGVARQKQPLKP